MMTIEQIKNYIDNSEALYWTALKGLNELYILIDDYDGYDLLDVSVEEEDFALHYNGRVIEGYKIIAEYASEDE